MSDCALTARWRAGVVVRDVVVDAFDAAEAAGLSDRCCRTSSSSREDAAGWESTKALLALSRTLQVAVTAAAESLANANRGLPLLEVQLGPPVPNAGKVICVGLNYHAHALELGQSVADVPNIFSKFSTSLIGHQEQIVLPSGAKQVDFEGEIAVIIGRPCRNVDVSVAADYIGGVTCFNDITDRNLQQRVSQWTIAKAADTFAPCGPFVVTLDEIDSISDLHLQTYLNGELMQDAYAHQMIYSIERLVAFVSSRITLLPGDIIATGTPNGVGFRREPPVFLSHGDTVAVTISAVGALENSVIREISWLTA